MKECKKINDKHDEKLREFDLKMQDLKNTNQREIKEMELKHEERSKKIDIKFKEIDDKAAERKA